MILVQLSDFENGQYNLARSTADDNVIQAYIDRIEKPTLYKLLGKELADLFIEYVIVELFAGDLVIATEYIIVDYKAGDDFTNIGAVSNTTGVIFTATGTTPTTWTNETIIRPYVARFENILNSFYLENNEAFSFMLCDGFDAKVYESTGIKDLLLINIYYWYLAETQIRQGQSGVYSQAGENSKILSPENSIRLGEQRWNNTGLKTWDAIRWYCLIKYKSTYPEYKGRPESSRSVFS